MNPDALAQLHDIQGLDDIPWWPIAPGWLLVALAIFLAFGLLLLIFRNIRRFPYGTWQRAAWKEWKALNARLNQYNDREAASAVSELLRRVAIARMGRASAAGLYGADWLDWLQYNDPKHFLWAEKGSVLLELPYSPPTETNEQRALLRQLLKATLPWIDYRSRHVPI